MQLIKGIQDEAVKLLIYGPEGIGKSTFAAEFPNPVFIDTEGSTTRMDVVRTPAPSSWTQLLEQIRYFIKNPAELSTLVIDTADWAEKMCIEHVCASRLMKSIEDAGYGRGYVFLAEEFGRFLNLLDELRGKHIHIVITAHAIMRKFEQPDEMGAYDRWELKLQKKTAPMLKEWVDIMLFANYKTVVVNVDNQGAQKGKNKVQGGQRVMYTMHHPCWDAKNRHGLKDELKFEFSEIANCIPASTPIISKAELTTPHPIPPAKSEAIEVIEQVTEPDTAAEQSAETAEKRSVYIDESVPKPLRDLMLANDVIEIDIQAAVASKGYYPIDTPIQNYDPKFINGVLVAAWDKVLEMVNEIRKDELPF